jgi:hypothetical protein
MREEEIRVSRRQIGGSDGNDVPADAFQELDIEIPVRGEVTDVTVRPVVWEQIEVRKLLRGRGAPTAGAVECDASRVDDPGEIA